jgi:hypothetical protein
MDVPGAIKIRLVENDMSAPADQLTPVLSGPVVM